MNVTWSGDDGTGGFTLGGGVDRLFVTPMAQTAAGRAGGALNWILSQPDAELSTGSTVVPLRSLAAPGQPTWAVRQPLLDGRFRVADAGDASAPLTRRVYHAIAVVRGHCADLTPAVRALAKAGAIAVRRHPGRWRLVRRDGRPAHPDPGVPGPAVPARHLPGRRRRADRHPPLPIVRCTTWRGRGTARYRPARPSTGATRRLGRSSRRTTRSAARRDANGLRLDDVMVGWVPGRDVAAFWLIRPVVIPGTVTHYADPIARWERIVQVADADGIRRRAADRAADRAPRRHDHARPLVPRAGQQPRVATPDVVGLNAQPNRQGDTLNLYTPEFVDDAAHFGTDLYSDEFVGRVYLDGDLLWEADTPGSCGATFPGTPRLPAGLHDRPRQRVLAAVNGDPHGLDVRVEARDQPHDHPADWRRHRRDALGLENHPGQCVHVSIRVGAQGRGGVGTRPGPRQGVLERWPHVVEGRGRRLRPGRPGRAPKGRRRRAGCRW